MRAIAPVEWRAHTRAVAALAGLGVHVLAYAGVPAIGRDKAPPVRAFYVDPDFKGQLQNGSAQRPWNSPRAPGMWKAINAALASGPVTVYFSAREAESDAPETIMGPVGCRRGDRSTNRLALDGMSKWNTNDTQPAWQDYKGKHFCKIIGRYSMAIGWGQKSPYPKQDYVTVRGFECTGEGARVLFAGDHVVFEHLYIHDVTGVGPAIHILYTYKETRFATVKDRALDACTDMTIRNVRIENVYGEAIYVGSVSPAVPHDVQRAMGNEHSHITIENAFIRNPGTGGGQGDGIDCKGGITHVTIRDCDIAGFNGMAGIILPQTLVDTDQHILVERCYIHHSAPKGEARRAIYAGAGSRFPRWGYRGITIRNCLVDATRLGISVYKSDRKSHLRDVQILNNTILNVGHAGLTVQVDSNAVVKSNLLFDNDQGKVQAHISGRNVVSDYNAYHGSWHHAGEGEHSFALTAEQKAQLLTHLKTKVFRLPSNAAVVDKGMTLEGFSDDIAGTRRPQGAAWDIGAYEYIKRPLETPPRSGIKAKE